MTATALAVQNPAYRFPNIKKESPLAVAEQEVGEFYTHGTLAEQAGVPCAFYTVVRFLLLGGCYAENR